MKKVDYIIVGLGIAGLAFAETLRINNKSFVVFGNNKNGATSASGGVLNPTVLKRFTAAWNVEQFVKTAIPFYENLGYQLNSHLIKPIAIQRILNSVEEQNNWMVASDKEQLKNYLDSSLIANSNSAVNAPFKLGNVNQGFQINPGKILSLFKESLIASELYHQEEFDHHFLEEHQNSLSYKNYTSTYIVFSEGAGVVNNPYFPVAVSPEKPKVFVANKGEYIIVKAPKLKSKAVIKGPVMLIPLGDDLYKVGASYGRDDFSTNVTSEAQNQISEKLKTMITCEFEVVDQVTGIRPTVKDRKPLIGTLHQSKNIAFLNGLGTRGLTMAPLLAQQLFDFLENNTPLPEEINIRRFL